MESIMKSYAIPRHKVFISYYHKDDQAYKNYLIELQEFNADTQMWQSIFDDYSVRENDIDDTGLTDETIRKIIRDDYINEASVLILLCGNRTKERKFIDWELHAAMYDTEEKPKLGIVVINLPSIRGKSFIHVGQDDEKSIVGGQGTRWSTIDSRAGYEQAFPFLPSRLIDNLESGIDDNTIVPFTVVEWEKIYKDTFSLKTLIDNAFNRSRDKRKHYNHSSPLRERNSNRGI